MTERVTLLISGGGPRLRRNLRLVTGIYSTFGDANDGLLFFMAGNQGDSEKRGHRCDSGSLEGGDHT
jgi:hypothetical protein